MMIPLISICIPSYNRPKELQRLLLSVDVSKVDSIEIIVCEDMSPGRLAIREVCERYKKESAYKLRYFENFSNLGYDANLRELISKAEGEYVMFMGDDDEFVEGALDKYIEFLLSHLDSGYILRSYQNIYKNGSKEVFRYYPKDQTFIPGKATYVELFDKSVFISGFCVKTKLARFYETDNLDGSLLYQLYLLAEICLSHPSSYCRIILTQARVGESIPYFGNSDAEKELYTPGAITTQNSINFLSKYFEVISFIDKKNGISSINDIRRNMSKYSYPAIAIQREGSLFEFFRYTKQLKKLGLNESWLFYLYVYSLVIFGKRNCDEIIRFLKRVYGKRPNL